MVLFKQDGLVFEDEDNVDQYDVRLDSGELVVTYLPNNETWRFGTDGEFRVEKIDSDVFRHSTTVSEDIDIPAGKGTVLAGPIDGEGSISGDGRVAVVRGDD